MALDLIAPLIPSGQDSKGPEIFTHALGQGLAAVARLSQQRRDSEMEMLKLAEHERLSQEQNALEKEKMANDYEIRQATLASSKTVNDAHAEYYRAGADAYARGTKTASQRAIARQQSEQAFAEEIDAHATELNLNDPVFSTKEPVQFAANVLQFKDSWGRSPLPWVKEAIKKYQTEADQQKISLKPIDADGNAIGKAAPVPVWQVVKNLQDPETKERTIAMLKANGHMSDTVKKTPGTATQSWSRPIDTMWDAIVGPTEKKEIVEEPSPVLKSVLDKSKGVKFERVPSRVPQVASPKTGAFETLPDPDIPPDTTGEPQARNSEPKFDTTQTDLYIQHAKAAIAKGAPAAAVAARLQELGIDPTPVFEA